jgi:hypothetical protein
MRMEQTKLWRTRLAVRILHNCKAGCFDTGLVLDR